MSIKKTVFQKPIAANSQWSAVAHSLLYLILNTTTHPNVGKLTEKLSSTASLTNLSVLADVPITVYHHGQNEHRHEYTINKHYGSNYPRPITLLQEGEHWFSLLPSRNVSIVNGSQSDHKVLDPSVDLDWLFKPTQVKLIDNQALPSQKGGGRKQRKKKRWISSDFQMMDDRCHQGNELLQLYREKCTFHIR